MRFWERFMRAINGPMKEGHTPVKMWKCPFDGGECNELFCEGGSEFCTMANYHAARTAQVDWRSIFREGAKE